MSTKILVVDDEIELKLLMQQRFRRKIQSGDYLFRFAISGQEALTALRNDPDVDVLLLDINIPDVDGLTLLGQLPELAPTSRAVMVSAYGDLTNVRTAMNRGAFDFVMKPINFQDLELTIEKTARHVGQLRESIRTKAVADLKARFFDNITHEFRTPLSLIMAPVDVLLQNPRHDESTRRSLLTIQRNAHQLLHLINQLLDLAKLEADSLPIVALHGDAITFLEELIHSFGVIAEQKALQLTFITNVSRLDTLFDPDKWQKIVANLIANAIKFTARGGSITVNCTYALSQLTLTVGDTGIGIPEEHLSHIFDRFYQVDTSLTRAYEGSGIGLALAYELTRRLGGQLSVESQLTVGTTFTVDLPIQQTTASDYPPTQRQPQPKPEPWTVVLQPAVEPKEVVLPLVLLVDDNAELVAFIAQSLVDQFHILTANNGREGLAIAQRELPDIVVSDVMMPEMNGYQLTHHLKTDPSTDHITVILLTARTAAQSRREGLLVGADEYLTKPFDLSELQLRLRNSLTRQQKLRDYYLRHFGPVNPASNELDNADPQSTLQNAFLTRLNQIIEEHLDDSTFRIEALAEGVAMSSRTLTRKLSALTGSSPARFIRNYRLGRAVDFLLAGHPISETAYLIGFEHPTNFATVFKETYGQSPTEYIVTRK